MIRLENISKNVKTKSGEISILENVSLTIKDNDFLMISGRSGSGKSTLLNIIGLVDNLTSGEIYYGDQVVSKFSEDFKADIRANKMGYIYQSYFLIPHLNVIDNLFLVATLVGGADERYEYCMSLLKKLGIENRKNHFPATLSGGEQQRVAIARAIVNDPKYIFADEPTGSLDGDSENDVMKILKELNDNGKCIIMVTHNPELEKYSTRKIIIENHKVYEN